MLRTPRANLSNQDQDHEFDSQIFWSNDSLFGGRSDFASPNLPSDMIVDHVEAPDATPTLHKSTTEAAQQITRDNYSWSSSLGTGATISFGFRTSAPDYTVNGRDVVGTFTAFTSQEQAAARAALSLWSSVANITFTDLGNTNNATILFGNYSSSTDNSEAFAFNPVTKTTASTGNNRWEGDVFMNTYYASTTNVDPGTYEFMTFIHEIGHALGLEHPGAYNAGPGQTITYDNNAEYVEDTRMYTLMSYFDESFTGGSFSVYDETPMLHDIAAIQRLYGANTSTFSGNTVYGFNGTAGSPYSITSASQHVVFTVYDRGGTDTLDFSGYSQSATIDLRPEHFSSVGGDTNNVAVGTGVNIENAVGGSGNDLIIVNPALVGTLTGNGGADTFQSTIFGLGAYTITDMSVADRINFTDGSLSTFTYFENGTSLSYGNGSITNSLTLSNNPVGHFYYKADGTYGGVDLVFRNGIMGDDFNHDHMSDILWQADNGTVVIWTVNDHSHTGATVGPGPVSSNWHLVATGDFNANGTQDIMWRDNTGDVVSWNMNGTSYTGYDFGHVDLTWQIASPATGDFNGDGNSDILWRSSTGELVSWDMNNHAYSGFDFGHVDTSWQVSGLGDFDGDGKSDILWRDGSGEVVSWTMNDHLHTGFDFGHVDSAWQIVGVGDFDADGKSDLLWRDNTGEVVTWNMNNHSYSGFDLGHVDTSWKVATIGDFNGDGRSDILWRDNSGELVSWTMNNHAHTGYDFGHVDPSYHVMV
ncbi:M10 family metallopeptidase C-terminal domain-containing protein [Bradyrhizobium sp. BR 10289]|uniref:M10 family metallopeptidase C-terminal domain-containing protein n=1 Tax=Bradyrhizobium sp. BR 10289 TaxID=2749993 RepID=UPI001C653829|nr:M10 family metallopeptidase C-terminal domain-containing protein [Bradyrhizobium sp. BR 10289]MBW7974504.1 M10 family metallopeptidase C-terminal domain-containing protein [Bradyrhizobium sp. BR 10289]